MLVHRAALRLRTLPCTVPSVVRRDRCRRLHPFYMSTATDAVTVTATGSRAGYGDNLKEYQEHWEQRWTAGVDPGTFWDARRSAPSLCKLLESDPDVAFGKTVVVPGCGRGYDLLTFSRYASKAVGVEISETAVRLCLPSVFDWLSPSGVQEQFDVGYDYTFFCALHPDMREDWAEGWARAIKPGGTLIALCFPIEVEGRPGPPWPLQVSDYEKVLLPRGFKCTRRANVPEEDSTASGRAGKEIMTVWVKEDGAVGGKL